MSNKDLKESMEALFLEHCRAQRGALTHAQDQGWCLYANALGELVLTAATSVRPGDAWGEALVSMASFLATEVALRKLAAEDLEREGAE